MTFQLVHETQDLRKLHRQTSSGTNKLRGLAASGKVGTPALCPRSRQLGT